ncbi:MULTISPECIES: methionine--tRNA ligase [unclassified Rhizobium]|uniref:methionine--tRNA ligase n=1 Tax=unclassified Rhizobium TaxID=2613769 RepID=UPI000EAA22CB|nr:MULTISPECIES: methionine--tRNA ligase [unclassified Rhizobium]AYG66268.1 methionine--tRNA ligase [Rhizobium sp. CCGE531]AYG72650.1 methionine--tRNA ligase [Rhizobium sp. CCGE532]
MTEKTPFYITTAIAYPNGKPHIGHAYELIATDAMARFQRLDGRDVFFLTGTDEHGQKMQQTARAEGMEPQQLANRNSDEFQAMGKLLNASNDDFIRTTQPRHHETSQNIWNLMADAGDIYKDSYAGWYSVRDEAYYQENETELRADGVRYGPQGTPVEWVQEESYFFKLSEYQDRLLKLYEENPDFIGPAERRNEVISFVKSGLKDLSISRTTFDWGIKVPNDPAHVMYVWVDALTNYITATGYIEDRNNPRAKYWPADLHVIGKDIIRFHAVYWPAFLMSAKLPLPKRVYAHGFLLNKGEKMSKSLGNVVDPVNLVNHFGLDQVRYFFLREVSFGQDGSYSEEAIGTRINSDLANGIGNLASRSLSMIVKNCDGQIPECGPLTDEDKALLAQADALLASNREDMGKQLIHRALASIISVVSETDRYFASQEPWALKKTDPARMATVLHVTADVVRQIGILLQPFMPESSAKLLDLIAIPADKRDFAALGEAGRLVAGTPLEAPKPVFPRYVAPTVE